MLTLACQKILGTKKVCMIRQIPYLVSLLALICAAAMTLRFRDIPWIVPAYLIIQSMVSLLGWLALQRMNPDSRGWMLGFVAALAVVLLFIGWTGFCFVHVMPFGWQLFVGYFGSNALLAFSLSSILKGRGDTSGYFDLALIQGAVLSASGTVLLISIIGDWNPSTRYCITALGWFWLLLGAQSFGYAMGITKKRELWIALNSYVPALLAIAAMAWLCLKLSGLQGEVAREAVLAVN